jgi:uncharacterized membrane protein (DUF485 family)
MLSHVLAIGVATSGASWPSARGLPAYLETGHHGPIATTLSSGIEGNMQSRNARIGLVLFGVYLLVYAGYVLINALDPELMEWTPAAGVNLAIWYGMGLIALAFLLALAYGFVCRQRDDATAERRGGAR